MDFFYMYFKQFLERRTNSCRYFSLFRGFEVKSLWKSHEIIICLLSERGILRLKS